MALDLGTHMGVCIGRWGHARGGLIGEPGTLSHEHHDLTPAKGTGPGNSDRSFRMWQALEQIAQREGSLPIGLAYEHVTFMANTFAALVAGELAGTARLWAYQNGVPLFGFHPSTVKVAGGGHGAMSKDGVEAAVRHRFNIHAPLTPDEADAVAVLCCLIDNSLTSNIKKVPAVKRPRKPKALPEPTPDF